MKVYEKAYATERPEEVVFSGSYVYVNSNIVEATEEEKLNNGFGEDVTLYSFTKTEYERDEYIHETYLPKFNRKLTAADNFDTLTEPGVYFYMTESIPGNCPYENAGIVEVVRTGEDNTRVLQRITRYGQAGKSAFRTLFEGTWHAWTEIEVQGCVCGTYTGNGKSNRDINIKDCNGNIAFIYCPSGGDTGVVLVTPIGGIRFFPDSEGMTTGEPISISISYGYLNFWSDNFNTKGIEYEYQIMK